MEAFLAKLKELGINTGDHPCRKGILLVEFTNKALEKGIKYAVQEAMDATGFVADRPDLFEIDNELFGHDDHTAFRLNRATKTIYFGPYWVGA